MRVTEFPPYSVPSRRIESFSGSYEFYHVLRILAIFKEALIKALFDFAKSIFMQGKEKDDENSKLFKESFDAALYKYAAKSDSSI